MGTTPRREDALHKVCCIKIPVGRRYLLPSRRKRFFRYASCEGAALPTHTMHKPLADAAHPRGSAASVG